METWRDAYRGIIADTTLEGLDVGQRAGKWREMLSAKRDIASLIYVAVEEEDEGVVGFASGGRTRRPELPYDAELYALYVLPGSQRRGLGRLLTRSLVGELERRGFGSLLVEVLEANAPARRFYEALGAVAAGERPLVVDGVTYATRLYGWARIGDVGSAGL